MITLNVNVNTEIIIKIKQQQQKKKIIFEAEWDSFKPHNEEQPEREKKPHPKLISINRDLHAK